MNPLATDLARALRAAAKAQRLAEDGLTVTRVRYIPAECRPPRYPKSREDSKETRS